MVCTCLFLLKPSGIDVILFMAVLVMIPFDCFFFAELTIQLLGLTIYCHFKNKSAALSLGRPSRSDLVHFQYNEERCDGLFQVQNAKKCFDLDA